MPVKFQVIAPDGSFVTDALAKLYLAEVSDDVIGTYDEAESTGKADWGNTFRYDPEANQYIFNLGTKGLSTGTWVLQIVINDLATKEVWVSLR